MTKRPILLFGILVALSLACSFPVTATPAFLPPTETASTTPTPDQIPTLEATPTTGDPTMYGIVRIEGSTEFIVLCGHDSADNDFVYYLCREPEFRKFAISRMEGTSGRQRVAWP